MPALSLSHKSGVILTPTFLTAHPLHCKGTRAEPEKERWFVYYRLTSLWYHDKMGKNRHKIGTNKMEYKTMGKIITNLRKRMREKGYTRAKFAEICDINEETLKKYLRKDDYPTRWLKVFADKLDCTYDYLLGKSEVPEREYQDMRNETGLSICAIDELKKYKKINKIDVVNCLLENSNFMISLITYIDMPEEFKSCYKNYVEESIRNANLNEYDIKLGKLVDIEFNYRHDILLELELMKQEYEKK